MASVAHRSALAWRNVRSLAVGKLATIGTEDRLRGRPSRWIS